MAGYRTIKKGSITIFLSLIFLVMLSLIGALLESASIRIERNDNKIRMELAMESLFAEYDKELLDKYDLFTLIKNEDETIRRVDYFGPDDLEHEIMATERLSDYNGTPFYRLAVQQVKTKYGLDCIWDNEEFVSGDYEKTETQIMDNMETMLEENGQKLPCEENPIYEMEKAQKTGILKLVLPREAEVSEGKVVEKELSSVRDLKKGNFQKSGKGNFAENLMFRQYLVNHFDDYIEKKTEGKLRYEIEYLIAGKTSDIKNLTKVVNKILLTRAAVNYLYLQTDTERKTEAQTLATSLCMLLEIPGLDQAVSQGILISWAYGESVAEVQILMDGGKIELRKTNENWMVSLSETISLSSMKYTKEKGQEKGVTYSELLQTLLGTVSVEDLKMRALDLLEMSLGIKVDECITRMEIKSNYKNRRGMSHEFHTGFGYQ